MESIRADIEYIFSRYSHFASFYRHHEHGRPLFYVYDSYHIDPIQWMRLLTNEGDLSIRQSKLDADFIGLWLQPHHGRDLIDVKIYCYIILLIKFIIF